mmetsp:Transcript_26802/g.25664  ORF Transcript_26802/g.25664 Transcript_26802/m.25664 type:complete len:94 (+) Transcript_26802:451-732(+)
MLSSPARSWKSIGFHWCQPSDSITTCCTTSKIVNTDEGKEPKREPETPKRPKRKLYESSNCATTPIHCYTMQNVVIPKMRKKEKAFRIVVKQM